MITITITNVYCQLENLTDKQIISKIDMALSYFVPGYNYIFAYKTGKWDGRTHLLSKNLKLQSGLLPYLEDILKKENVEYILNDMRKDPILGKEILLSSNYYTPRDYQIAAVEAVKNQKVGIIKVATGGGKSLIISMLCAALNIKSVIYVISLDLLYQMKKDIEDALNIEIGIVGNGECIIKKITIATPWTVVRSYDRDYEPFDDEEPEVKEELTPLQKIKIQKMVEAAQMFIYDECQMMGGSVSQFIAKNSKEARYRIGTSGTPWRSGDDSILLEASTGKQLIDINATSLIDRGILVRPKIHFFNVPENIALEKLIQPSYHQVYETYIVENELRNEMIIDCVKKLFDNNRKILILVKRKKHGLKLLELIPKHIKSYYLNGDAGTDERQAVKDLFNIGKLNVILATSIFDQGIDLPLLDALILAGGGKSSNRALQRIGRVIRSSPGKQDAIVVDFVDNAPFLLQHSRKRLATYKQEKGFQIKLPQ